QILERRPRRGGLAGEIGLDLDAPPDPPAVASVWLREPVLVNELGHTVLREIKLARQAGDRDELAARWPTAAPRPPPLPSAPGDVGRVPSDIGLDVVAKVQRDVADETDGFDVTTRVVLQRPRRQQQ